MLSRTENRWFQGLFKALNYFPVLFKACLIFKDFSGKPFKFKYFSSLCTKHLQTRFSHLFFWCMLTVIPPISFILKQCFCLVWCFTSQSTAMAMSGWLVHLTTLFSWASLTKHLTNIKEHFRLDFIMEANNMKPVWSGSILFAMKATYELSLIWVHIVCNKGYLSTWAEEMADNKSHDWLEKG